MLTVPVLTEVAMRVRNEVGPQVKDEGGMKEAPCAHTQMPCSASSAWAASRPRACGLGGKGDRQTGAVRVEQYQE